MNATDWASELLSRHAAVLSCFQIEETKALIADGDGWLAAYDLFQDGYKDGWLTQQDLREALDLARHGMFSKLSGNIEKKARARLIELAARAPSQLLNATDWATQILSRHSAVLTSEQVRHTQAYVRDGDGWLAAYDLFQDGLRDGWLTEKDAREVLDLADRRMFSKFSGSVKEQAADLLQTNR